MSARVNGYGGKITMTKEHLQEQIVLLQQLIEQNRIQEQYLCQEIYVLRQQLASTTIEDQPHLLGQMGLFE